MRQRKFSLVLINNDYTAITLTTKHALQMSCLIYNTLLRVQHNALVVL